MAHSLTGASSAKRWMTCGGYLHLARTLAIDPNRIDPDYTREGTAAHHFASVCLVEGKDAWEFTGETIEGVVIGEGETEVSPTAIQEHIDNCRALMALGKWFVETVVGENEALRPHKGFYGTLDFGVIDVVAKMLRIRDLKMGKGVYVDPEWNEQMLYYAFGMLLWLKDQDMELPSDWQVELGICQPRYYDYEGVRTWTTTVQEVLDWGWNVLIPRMAKVDTDPPTFVPGEHCRFCPVKLRCPVMRAMYGAAVKASATAIEDCKEMTDEQLGMDYSMIPMAEMYIKAVKGETDWRAGNGRLSKFWKLVKKKMDRVWKDGASTAMIQTLGDDLALTPRALKSPAQIEKISSHAKKLVAEWAYTPEGGMVAARVDDKRLPEKATTVAKVFSEYEGRSF